MIFMENLDLEQELGDWGHLSWEKEGLLHQLEEHSDLNQCWCWCCVRDWSQLHLQTSSLSFLPAHHCWFLTIIKKLNNCSKSHLISPECTTEMNWGNIKSPKIFIQWWMHFIVWYRNWRMAIISCVWGLNFTYFCMILLKFKMSNQLILY